MNRHRPDLIVPIRDRRQHKRYLTLKNVGIAAGTLFVLFVIVTLRSEMRGTGPAYYGRLYERELPKVEQKLPAPVEVVSEQASTPVDDATHADPMLVAPAARSQWLQDDPATPTVDAVALPRAQASVASGETRVAIVGDGNGVAIVQQQRKRPVLAGGFGR